MLNKNEYKKVACSSKENINDGRKQKPENLLDYKIDQLMLTPLKRHSISTNEVMTQNFPQDMRQGLEN